MYLVSEADAFLIYFLGFLYEKTRQRLLNSWSWILSANFSLEIIFGSSNKTSLFGIFVVYFFPKYLFKAHIFYMLSKEISNFTRSYMLKPLYFLSLEYFDSGALTPEIPNILFLNHWLSIRVRVLLFCTVFVVNFSLRFGKTVPVLATVKIMNAVVVTFHEYHVMKILWLKFFLVKQFVYWITVSQYYASNLLAIDSKHLFFWLNRTVNCSLDYLRVL